MTDTTTPIQLSDDLRTYLTERSEWLRRDVSRLRHAGRATRIAAKYERIADEIDDLLERAS